MKKTECAHEEGQDQGGGHPVDRGLQTERSVLPVHLLEEEGRHLQQDHITETNLQDQESPPLQHDITIETSRQEDLHLLET